MELTEPHRSLWPDGGQTETSEAFHVLGHPEKAQILLPVGSRKSSGRSLIRYHGGMGFGTRFARRGAAILARLGILGVMTRDRSFVDFGDIDDPGSLRSILSNATGEADFTVSISFGPPRANQKPVIRIIRLDGHTVAFAKVGWNPLTARLVEAEVAALATPGLSSLTNVVAPRVLHSGPWKSNRVAVFEALEGQPGKLTPRDEAFTEVARVWPSQQLTLGESLFAEHLIGAARAVESTGRELWVRTVERLIETYGGDTFDFAGWHGDWTPWNNVRFNAHRIAVWDWERAGQQVPEGFDSIHYRFQPVLLKNKQPTVALIAASTRALGTLSPARREALGRLYVANIALRHLQPEATGGPVQQSTRLLADLGRLLEN